MTTTSRPNAVVAAQQGNPQAIALLLNQALQSHAQTAKVIRHESALRILVQGEAVPEQATIGPLIEQGLRQLGLAAITPTIQIYGQSLGQSVPAWSIALNLALDEAMMFRFDPVPVEPPISPPIAVPPAATPRSAVPLPPPRYTGLAILAFFMGVFPLNLMMFSHWSQVSKHYREGDYDGAEIASAQVKLWCQVNLGLGIPLRLIILMVVFLGGVSAPNGAAKGRPTPPEAAAVQRLQAMMEAERKFWVDTGKLSPTISMPEDNSTAAMVAPYRYTVTMLDARRVQVTAVPTRKGLHSFTAASMLVRLSDEETAESAICRSAKPSMQPVPMPIVVNGGRSERCAPDTKVVLSSFGMVEDAFTPQVSEEEE
jgi:Interferon-induced transmembrane protein